jgi:hypothetical protein
VLAPQVVEIDAASRIEEVLDGGAAGGRDPGVRGARKSTQELLGEEVRPEDIGGEGQLGTVLAELVAPEAVVEIARVMDQDVQAGVPAPERLGKAKDGFSRRDVQAHHFRGPARRRGPHDLRSRDLTRLEGPARHDHVVPLRDELHGGGFADAGTRPGDDDSAPVHAVASRWSDLTL